MYGETAVVLFVIDDRRLQVCSTETTGDPKAGSTIIALVQTLP